MKKKIFRLCFEYDIITGIEDYFTEIEPDIIDLLELYCYAEHFLQKKQKARLNLLVSVEPEEYEDFSVFIDLWTTRVDALKKELLKHGFFQIDRKVQELYNLLQDSRLKVIDLRTIFLNNINQMLKELEVHDLREVETWWKEYAKEELNKIFANKKTPPG